MHHYYLSMRPMKLQRNLTHVWTSAPASESLRNNNNGLTTSKPSSIVRDLSPACEFGGYAGASFADGITVVVLACIAQDAPSCEEALGV